VSDDTARAPSSQPTDAEASGVEIPEPPPELGEETTPEILPEREPFRTVLRGLSLVEQAIGVFLLLAILVLVLIQVAQRYIPGTGFPATGELARLAMVWLTFVLSGYLMGHDGHIALRVIDYVLPVRVIGVIQIIGRLFVALTCAALAYAVYDLIVRDPGLVTPAAQLPLTVVYAVALYGLASTALRAIVAVVVVDVPAVRSGRGRVA